MVAVKVLSIIGCIVLGILALVLFIKAILFKKHLLDNFKRCNVIVAGKKGTGKGLVFQYVINHRHDDYYSNINYSQKYDKRFHRIYSLNQVSTMPNTYLSFINNQFERTPHLFKEGKDIYIDDIGVFLPSYMDSTLYKKFPSMPIFYALSRHLYNSNVHCNTQNIERGWKALREQADFYIQVRKTIKLFGFFFITFMTTYDRYQSALQNLRPIKTRMLNKYSKAQVDVFNAQNGMIKNGFIIQTKRTLHYDTRAFEKVLLKGKRKY